MNKSLVLALVAAGALASIADMALASTTGTGIQAGFGTLNTALDGLIKGAGGYLVLILSVIVGGVTLAELVAIDFAMMYTQDALQEMVKSASNTDAFGDKIAEFQATVSKTLDSFAVYRQAAQEKYQHAIASLEKLVMAKSLLAASGASKFAGQMGISN